MVREYTLRTKKNVWLFAIVAFVLGVWPVLIPAGELAEPAKWGAVGTTSFLIVLVVLWITLAKTKRSAV